MGQISGAVARQREQQKDKVNNLRGFLQQMTPEIQRALPKGMDGDRIARLALTVVRKTPKLADCTPESFAGALLTASALGLEPGVNDEAYLVPYGSECQLIVGYKGLAKLFYQHPMAADLQANVVYERDEFDYEYGTKSFLRHKPARGDRGEVTDYYAVAKLTNGATAFVVLSPDEVKMLRRGKVGSTDVPDPQRWMERKTALKQLVKLLPKSTTLMRAVEADEQVGSRLRDDLNGERKAPQLEAVAQTEHGPVDTATGEILDNDDYAEPPAEFYDQQEQPA